MHIYIHHTHIQIYMSLQKVYISPSSCAKHVPKNWKKQYDFDSNLKIMHFTLWLILTQ